MSEQPIAELNEWDVVADTLTIPRPPEGADQVGSALGALLQGAEDAYDATRRDDTELGTYCAAVHFKLEALAYRVTPAMIRQIEMIADASWDLAGNVPPPPGFNPELRTPPATVAADELVAAYAEALRENRHDRDRIAVAREIYAAHCRRTDPEAFARVERACDQANAMLARFHADQDGGQR